MPRFFGSKAKPANSFAGHTSPSATDGQRVANGPRAAFFDVDNTLMQGASIFHLARGLHKRKYFTLRQISKMAWRQFYFRAAGVEDPEHVEEAKASALSFIAGHKVTDLKETGKEIYDEYMAEKIWPGTKVIAQDHIAAGVEVWIVTAAPVEIAETISERLGLTGALGTVSEHVDGVYTGKLVGDLLHKESKANAVKKLAEQKGFDLSLCYAYSDSYNDLPMLSIVGNPTAINPDSKLREHANANGWPIIDYRVGRKIAKISANTFFTAFTVWVVSWFASRAWRRLR